MNEIQLTKADRETIKTDIKLTAILGLTTDYQVRETKDGFVLKILSPYKIDFDLLIIPSTLKG